MCALAQAGLRRQEFPLATLLVGPEGAGKWIPLCGWSWGEREKLVGLPYSINTHPPLPEHLAVGRHWFLLALCPVWEGVQVPLSLCWWIWE